MTRHASFVPRGVIPAVILPFTPDLEVDEPAFRRHLRHVAGTRGVAALTVNAHSMEASSLSAADQRLTMDIALDEVGDRMPLVHGVYADGSIEAARLAAQAVAQGASALLVFPPNPFTLGYRPEMVVEHFRRVADAAGDVPLIVFNYPLAIGQGYRTELIVRLAEAVPTIAAIKDWCNDPTQSAENVRVLQSLARPVNVLSAHSAWLMQSLVAGCAGLLSGSGSVIADLQADLFDAVQRADLAEAQRLAERIAPLMAVFYAAPTVDMHNRMKEALVMLGRQERVYVRPPLVSIDDDERARLRAALVASGLLAPRAQASAAG
ncbi:MAG: dihydrodipicolinate synthase family protein [Acidimicrobiia bacterium]|nr:dihydrodipicolinate synthase family protein [Acidimicrobiia bacterium]